MHIRNHAQRKHIIDSLEALLYQLAVLSFLMSPSILALVTRTAAQFQLSKPREMDPGRTLRFWYFLIFLFNFGSLWAHTITGTAEGRAVILDFIGMSFTPSKLQLVLLDLLLLVLSVILTTIAYDTSYVLASRTDIVDPLVSTPHPTADSTSSPMLNIGSTSPSHSNTDNARFIIDFHLSNVLTHLRNPPSPPEQSDDLLPMPNTASLLSLRQMLWQRSRRASARTGETDEGAGGERRGNGSGQRTVPGGLDVDTGG